MGIGLLLGRRGIQGSCGGLNQIPGVASDCGGACRRSCRNRRRCAHPTAADSRRDAADER
ncbi:MAG: (Na+)-NQR maturation NqrM [Gammaproteobacteria bacterium]